MTTFQITYRLAVEKDEDLEEKIEGICLEQSVELPRSVLTPEIEKKVVGTLVSRKEQVSGLHEVVIAWPKADIGDDISQFLNLLYGNISLQPGIRILDAEWPALAPDLFRGPMFGIEELRSRYGIGDRPLGTTALKPMGSSPADLGDLCYQFACGGIDIIKDDHGLANQEFAPFTQRVEACVSAVRKAAEQTGSRARYFPNITAFSTESVERYRQAAEMGADGVLICPHISGMETMHRLARMDIDLPIIAHPAFSGQLTTHEKQGLSPDFLYGMLWRALGADFVIYPNKGGRFSFTKAECRAINRAARDTGQPFRRSFPMPGGGIKIETVGHWRSEYGADTAFLVGGSLYEHSGGIRKASREFRGKLKEN